MGKLFRRALAFLLGMIFGFTVLAGGIVGGAFWAYKNVKPVETVSKDSVEGLGDLKTATVEELLDLFAEAMENPDEYKLSRLEKEYGLDVRQFLNSIGINADDSKQVNVDAIRDVSVFTIFTDYRAFFDNIRFRALYVFIPKLTGKPLDEILSPEAQSKLGDYSVTELIEKDKITGEIGLIGAIKNLKLGSVLPSVFDYTYDYGKHEYTYEVKDGASVNALSLLGNAEVGTVFNLTGGSSIVDEIMDGGLSSVGDMLISDVVSSLAGGNEGEQEIATVADSAVGPTLADRAKAFGDTAVRDLFEKVDGKYRFTLDKLYDNLVIGYLLGFEKGSDGIWCKFGSNEPVKGLMQTLAETNIGDVMENKDNMKGLLVNVFGDVSLKEVVDTVGLAEKLPEGLRKIYTLTVRDVFDGDSESPFDNLLTALSVKIGESTVGELLGKESDNPVLGGVYDLKVGKLIEDVKNADNVLSVLQEAFGGIKLGDLLRAKKDENGEWISDNRIMSVLYDYTLNNVFDLISAQGNTTEMVKALLGDFSVGDFFSATYDYEHNENDGSWFRVIENTDGIVEYEYLDKDFAKALNVKLWQIVAAFDKNYPYNLRDDIGSLSVGEAYYSIAQANRKIPSGLIRLESGRYAFENEDIRQISEIIFAIDVNEIYEYRGNRQYWIDKLDPLTVQSLFGMFITDGRENENVFLKATLGITVGEFADLLGRPKEEPINKPLSELVQKHYKNVEFNGEVVETVLIGDAMNVFVKKWQNNCTMKTIGNLGFADSISALLGEKSKREIFGDVTLNGLISGYLSGALKESEFVKRTLNITVANVYDIYKKRNLEFTCHEVLEVLYKDLSVYDAVNFNKLGEKLGSYESLLKEVTLDSLIHAAHTKDWSAVKSDLVDAFKSLSKQAKAKLIVAVSGIAAVMYEIDNAKLVQLVTQILGDKTWGELITDLKGDCLGFEIVDGRYMLDGVYNALADRFLSQMIRVTVDKTQVNVKKDYIDEITFGNLLASNSGFDSVVDRFNESKLKTGKLASEGDAVENNVIFLEGDYERLTKVFFNVKLIEFWNNRSDLKTFLREIFGKIKLGDVGAPMFRRVANKVGYPYSYDVVGDDYVASGAFINVTDDLFNVTLNELYSNKNDLRAYIKSFFEKWSMGDLIADTVNLISVKGSQKDYNGSATLSEDKTLWTATGDYDEILNIIYNINSDSFLKGIKSGAKTYIFGDEVLGAVKIGQLANNGRNVYDAEKNVWYNENGEPIEFSGADGAVKKRILALTIGEVTKEDFKMTSVIDDIYMGEMLGCTCSEYADLSHEHTDACVWYKLNSAVIDGTDAPAELNVKEKELDQIICKIKLGTVMEKGLSPENIFSDSKLGDIFGFIAQNDGENTVWYNYKTTMIDGVKYDVVTSSGNGYSERIISGEPVTAINQAIADIDAKSMFTPEATDKIISAIKPLKLGEILNYVKVDGVWYKTYTDDGDVGNDVKVEKLMGKLAEKTVNDIENGFGDIVNEWTIADVLDETAIASSAILRAVKDVPLSGVSEEIENVGVGTAMGYSFSDSEGKWYDAGGKEVTGEINLVMAEYKIGHLTGKTPTDSGKPFGDDVVDKILNNVTVGAFYPDAGKGDGIMGLLSPDWKVGEIPDKLTDTIKNRTNVDQLIGLGAFGDFFVPEAGANNFTASGGTVSSPTNYGKIDNIMLLTETDEDLNGVKDADSDADGTVSLAEARAYWLSLSMPDFMNEILTIVTRSTMIP